MTDADLEIARRFEAIVARAAGGEDIRTLPFQEQVVYYVVAVRSEADMNGFCSVFEQLLTHESDVAFFVRVLRHLEENYLADDFVEIQRLLGHAGYFQDPTREFHALPAEVQERFKALERGVLSGDRLWDLDEKLLVACGNPR